MTELAAGTLVTPNVRLVRELGHGGMGSVWIADHLALDTQVVVKFIAADLARDPEVRARFSREASAAAKVKSPHVVQTFDHGITSTGLPYIVMELLDGEDLGRYLSTHGKMAPAHVYSVLRQAAKALSKAHAMGIVHRDVKPDNIFLCAAEQHEGAGAETFVKVLDFGIAKRHTQGLSDSDTRTGNLIGTPYYMSPEQLVGSKSIDPRTDVWSLGIVAFEALTGRRPFDGSTIGGLTLAIHQEDPCPSSFDASLPKGLDAWFRKACARKPDERFATTTEMATALGDALGLTGGNASSHELGALRLSTAVGNPSIHDPYEMTDAPTTPLSATQLGAAMSKAPPKRGSVATVAVLFTVGLVASAAVGYLVLLRPHPNDADGASGAAVESPLTTAPSIAPVPAPTAAPATTIAVTPSEPPPSQVALPANPSKAHGATTASTSKRQASPSPSPYAAARPSAILAPKPVAPPAPRPNATENYDIK